MVEDIGQPKGKLIIFQILCSNLCMSRGQDLHTLQTRLEVKTLLAEEYCSKDCSWITKEKPCHNIKFISTHSQRYLIRSSKICLQSVTSKHTFDEMANVTRIKIQMWRIYRIRHTLIRCRSHLATQRKNNFQILQCSYLCMQRGQDLHTLQRRLQVRRLCLQKRLWQRLFLETQGKRLSQLTTAKNH